MQADYLTPIKQKLQKQDVATVIGELIIINSPNIINEVRKRWIVGESVNGGIIGEYSLSPMGQEYKSYKMSLNPKANGHVDLILTGRLQEGLTVKKQSKTKFLVFSTDSKYDKIGNKYGFDEFGLSDQEWQEMQEEILSFAIETILDKAHE